MTQLLLIGCGKMGGALLSRWQHATSIASIHVVDPAATPKHEHHVSWHASIEPLRNIKPDVIVFAVKPDTLEKILPQYQKVFSAHSPIYLSIAAGKSIAFFKKYLGEHAHVVRAMPNLPATIGAGITALFAENTLSVSARQKAEHIMSAAGQTLWLENEEQMHAATALSGSGPAYAFYFLESLVDAGVKAGLSQENAWKLSMETVVGSCLLAATSPESFNQLRKNVASPGGTTEAAFSLLYSEWGELLQRAVAKAAEKSRELSE